MSAALSLLDPAHEWVFAVVQAEAGDVTLLAKLLRAADPVPERGRALLADYLSDPRRITRPAHRPTTNEARDWQIRDLRRLLTTDFSALDPNFPGKPAAVVDDLLAEWFRLTPAAIRRICGNRP